MSKATQKFKLNKIIPIALIAVLSLAILVFALLNVFQDRDSASASFANTKCNVSPMEMEPGSSCVFEAVVENGEGEPSFDNILTMTVGSELVLDTSSLQEIVGGQTFNITNVRTENLANGLIRYSYGPNSVAQNVAQDRPTDLPGSYRSVVRGRFTLKSDVLNRKQVGDILFAQPEDFTPPQGILFRFSNFREGTQANGGTPTAPSIAALDVKIVQPSNTNSSVSSANTSSAVTSSQQSSVTSSAQSSQNSSDNNSSNSSVSSAQSSSQSSSNSTCDVCFRPGDNDNRLYFMNDNGAFTWDPITRFNTSWNQTTLRAQVPVDIVFDNIKNNAGQQIANGSACTFEVFRYGSAASFYTVNRTADGGKIQMTMPTVSPDPAQEALGQTRNYYTIIAECNDSNTGDTIQAIDRLALPRGGTAPRL